MAFHIDATNLKLINEGKTKQIFSIENTNMVLIKSKDKITAFNAQRQNELEGKSEVATLTTTKVFSFLNELGLRTHFLKQYSSSEFIAKRCVMIPIEWVTRRIATGSFLKRNEFVQEGYRFSPPKLEIFYKDDEAGDPQWSFESLISSGLVVSGVTIGQREVQLMSDVTVVVFEVLERAWASRLCTLVDMKIEFGVDVETGDIVLADVIDSDSWRLWPHGDKRLQVDKQFYRDLPEVTAEALKELKAKFEWTSEQLKNFMAPPKGRVVCLMGSAADKDHCMKIVAQCAAFGLQCDLRVTSAHKGTEEALRVVAEYEGDGIPTVFICVAGCSNGLGPVLSGNTSYPVINSPPVGNSMWGSQDIWSSLRLPSGLGCATVMTPEAAGLSAASILALNDHVIWGRLRIKQLITRITLLKGDKQCVVENSRRRDVSRVPEKKEEKMIIENGGSEIDKESAVLM